MPPKKSKPRKKSGASRAQNAFAIANAEHPEIPTLGRGRSRIGHDEDIDSDGSGDGGNDSEGNEWKMGQVDSDDDSDIDSDEAMGESDEERFADYAFSGSTSKGGKKKSKKAAGGMDLDESDSEEEEEGSEEEDDEDEGGYVDLSTMLDRATPEDSDDENDADSEEEERKPKKNKKRSAPESDDEDGMKLLEEGSEDSEEESDEDSDDSMDSFHAFSDEEDVEEDPLKLQALQSMISGLPSSDRPTKRVRLDDPNEGKAPGEYNLALSNDTKKLSIADLLPSVTDATLRKSLKLLADEKDNSTKGGVPGKLSAPLAKRQQDRLDRAAAYVQTKDTLKRWVDTVKSNREAEHLHFPLANASNAPAPQQKKLIPINPSNSTPLNSFEATISDILKQSHMASEKQLAEFEELKTNKMSVEEVQARTAELRLARDLMYREEAKAKRVKKIKSKSYRRIKKRERVKEQDSIDAAMLEERGGEPDSEEDEERQRKRAEERMSLKHKQSRWAKGVKESGRAAWDVEARDGAVEMANRHEELRKRIQGKNMDSDASSDESDSEDEFDEQGERDRQKTLAEIAKLDAMDQEKGGRSKLMGMKFMQKAEAARKQENAAAIKTLKEDWEAGEKGSGDESEEEETTGRMSFKPQQKIEKVKKPKTTQEFEAPAASDDEDSSESEIEIEVTNKATATAKKATNPFSAPAGANTGKFGGRQQAPAEVEEANPWLADATSNIARPKAKTLTIGKQESKSAKVNLKITKDRRSAAEATRKEADGDTNVVINPNATLTITAKRSKDDERDDDDDAAINLIPSHGSKSDSQRELIKKAFAGDDVVRDFNKEKQQLMDDEDDKVVDDTLPGWGHWSGAGLSKKQKKFNANRRKVTHTVEGIQKDKRKDAKMDKVIVNEKRDKKVCYSVFLFLFLLVAGVLTFFRAGDKIPGAASAASFRDKGSVREKSEATDWPRVDHEVDVPGCYHAPRYGQAGPCGGAHGCAVQVVYASGEVAFLLHAVLYRTWCPKGSIEDLIDVKSSPGVGVGVSVMYHACVGSRNSIPNRQCLQRRLTRYRGMTSARGGQSIVSKAALNVARLYGYLTAGRQHIRNLCTVIVIRRSSSALRAASTSRWRAFGVSVDVGYLQPLGTFLRAQRVMTFVIPGAHKGPSSGPRTGGSALLVEAG